MKKGILRTVATLIFAFIMALIIVIIADAQPEWGDVGMSDDFECEVEPTIPITAGCAVDHIVQDYKDWQEILEQVEYDKRRSNFSDKINLGPPNPLIIDRTLECSWELENWQVTSWSDNKNKIEINTEEMDMLINTFVLQEGHDSFLLGRGQAFIDASNETGLDPIFLLGLAALESGWGSNPRHVIKNNPYSIRMTDENPDDGLDLGETMSEGIVNGAKWIKEHYYDEGQTCLFTMIYGEKCYASAKDHWIESIVRIMNDCYDKLKTYKEDIEV